MASSRVLRAVKDSHCSSDELYADSSQIHKRSQLVLIPTTAEMGSEMYPAMVSTRRNEKTAPVSYRLRADPVAVAPLLSAACPREIVKSSSIDAFVHVLESTISKHTDFFSSILSPRSLQLAYGELRNIVKVSRLRKEDLLQLCRGTILSTVPNGCAGCWGVHALAYPLSRKYRTRHRQASAILLLPVLESNFAGGPSLTSLVGPCLTDEDDDSCVGASIHYVLERVSDPLSLSVCLPKELGDIGVERMQSPLLARDAQKATILLGNSPVPISQLAAPGIYDWTRG